MTGPELKSMLNRVKLTAGDLASHLDIEYRTVIRWTSGETPITRVHEYAIRYLLEGLGLR